MKMIFTCDVVLDEKEGQNIHIKELFNNLGKVAHVCLFGPKPKRFKIHHSRIKYVPRLYIPFFGLWSYQISLFFYLYFYCKKYKIDVIYARQSPFSFIPLIISKHLRIPYIVEVNGLIIDEMMMFGQSKLSISTTGLSEKLGYEHAMKIVAITQGIKKGIMDLYNVLDEKIVVIGNGANIELFRPMDREETKKELKLGQDANYVCFVGNLAPWHGVNYLVEAAPTILGLCPNTRFLIVGDGSMKSEWMQHAKKFGVFNEFIFTGSVQYEKVPLYINASEMCVATFIKKRHMKIGGSPLKMYEYMACEKPVVSSRIPDIDFIEQENAGLLVEPENPQELAKAIITLMKDKKLRDTMGKNARKYVIENHSWEAVARKVADVCEQAIHG